MELKELEFKVNHCYEEDLKFFPMIMIHHSTFLCPIKLKLIAM